MCLFYIYQMVLLHMWFQFYLYWKLELISICKQNIKSHKFYSTICFVLFCFVYLFQFIYKIIVFSFSLSLSFSWTYSLFYKLTILNILFFQQFIYSLCNNNNDYYYYVYLIITKYKLLLQIYWNKLIFSVFYFCWKWT